MEFDKDYWEGRYARNDIPWDTGSHHNELPDLIRRFDLHGKDCYVPGCGYGYDAAFLAKSGVNTWASDISLTALEKARAVAESYSGPVSLIYGDMINPGDQYTGFFDCIFEYTTICSVKPEAQAEFMDGMWSLLKKDGLYITILFPLDDLVPPPPFPLDNIAFMNMIKDRFSLLYFKRNPASLKPRAGRESLHVYRKII